MWPCTDCGMDAVNSTTHIFTHLVGVEKHEARQTLWDMYLKSVWQMKQNWKKNKNRFNLHTGSLFEKCVCFSLWLPRELTGCSYIHIYFMQFYCSYFLHLTLWDCGLLTSVCLHYHILYLPLTVLICSFSLNRLYMPLRNDSALSWGKNPFMSLQMSRGAH